MWRPKGRQGHEKDVRKLTMKTLQQRGVLFAVIPADAGIHFTQRSRKDTDPVSARAALNVCLTAVPQEHTGTYV